MYESFFGLREKPFSKTPDPRFLYESRQHREALARLEYACEEREIALLTGEIGAGKTLLSRALIDRLGAQGACRPVLLIHPRMTPGEFLKTLCQTLGLTAPRTRHEMTGALHEFLLALHEDGKSLALMLDEAQMVPGKSTFDEIRLLTNFQLDDVNLLSVVFIGQPELRRRFQHPAYKPLAQRIGLRYHLKPFDREDSEAYVRHRLAVAGTREEIFTPGALDLLHEGAGGVPRLLSTFAHAALIEAFGREQRRVDSDVVKDAVADFLQHGQLTRQEVA
jgi:type II secretory pathway predicted ATPase ExeA